MAKAVEKETKITPLMKQYNQIKGKYPDALLLFRVGDFYETFGKDAIVASKVLGIVLTARNNGGSKLELAGFPHHSLDTYLPKLVRAGKRVAICDQLEDPKKTKKIVKRGVTELVTPGVAFNDQVLEHKKTEQMLIKENLFGNVPMVGLEPTLRKPETDFESVASTNFATSALMLYEATRITYVRFLWLVYK